MFFFSFADVSELLKNLINIQKENLAIEKQRLELEKQTLEYHKTLGTQLISLLPAVQKIACRDEEKSSKPDSTPRQESRQSRKRPCPSDSKYSVQND